MSNTVKSKIPQAFRDEGEWKFKKAYSWICYLER